MLVPPFWPEAWRSASSPNTQVATCQLYPIWPPPIQPSTSKPGPAANSSAPVVLLRKLASVADRPQL